MNELKEMEAICARLGIEEGVRIKRRNKNENMNVYGYQSHLEVYRVVFDLVVNYSNKERSAKIKELMSGKLRDIKCKIYSEGVVGRSDEMRTGIIKKCKKLKTNYDKQPQTSLTEMDKILEKQRIERQNQAELSQNAPLKRRKRKIKKKVQKVKKVKKPIEEIDEAKKIDTLLIELKTQMLGCGDNEPNQYNPRL